MIVFPVSQSLSTHYTCFVLTFAVSQFKTSSSEKPYSASLEGKGSSHIIILFLKLGVAYQIV